MKTDEYIEKQLRLCEKYSVNPDLISLNEFVAIGKEFNSCLQINGLRHPKTESLSGWYIWSDEDFDPDETDFFKPMHILHLLDIAPFVISYLGLPPGIRFLIDSNGYEDVWEDSELLNI